MNWSLQIETELQRIRPGENPGRTRATARRIAGIALQHFYNKHEEDFLRLLQSSVNDPALPPSVNEAAGRLAARLDADFTSPSLDPVGDAMIVVEFVKSQREH